MEQNYIDAKKERRDKYDKKVKKKVSKQEKKKQLHQNKDQEQMTNDRNR